MLTHRRTLPWFLALHVALAALVAYRLLPWWPFLMGILAHGILITWGSLNIDSGFYLKALCRGTPGTLALTYDDGPHPDHTPALLDLLKAEGVQAGFFCIGNRVARWPELVRRMVDEGHLVGSHSMDHPWQWGFMGVERTTEQILLARDVIEAATGVNSPYFRPPFGVTSPPVATAVKATGMQVIGWDVRPFDTTFRSVEDRLKRIFGPAPKGTIVVLHDTVGPVVETTKAIIDRCRASGIRLVRVDHSLTKQGDTDAH